MGTAEIAIVVYGLIFTVMLILSIKRWRWFHVFMMFLLLGSNVVLFSYAGRVLQIRHEWTQKYETNVINRDQAAKDLQELLYGTSPNGQIVSETSIANSLVAMRHDLQRILMGRGRVWRGATLGNVQGVQGIVNTTATATMADDQHGIEQGTRIFLFRETNITPAAGVPAAVVPAAVDPAAGVPAAVNAAMVNVPAVYLGEYNVEANNGASITLKNVFAPKVFNPALMANGASIVLYEKIPTDAHAPFAVKPNDRYKQQRGVFEDNQNPMFGLMDPAHVTGIFKTVTDPLQQQLQTVDLAAMVDRFIADGSRLAEREAKPRNVWFKIRFTQDLTEPLSQNVNGDDVQANIEGSDYRAGEAVVPMLYHRTPSIITVDQNGVTSVTPGVKTDGVTFKKDEIIFIASAEKIVQGAQIVPVSILVSGGDGIEPVAEKLLEYYVRPVHNYTDVFHNYPIRVSSLNFSNTSALHDIGRITESRNKATIQVLFRKGEKKDLELDLELYRRDEVEAGSYAGQLQTEVVKLTAELAAIFERNQEYAQKLIQIQSKLEADINAKQAASANADSE